MVFISKKQQKSQRKTAARIFKRTGERVSFAAGGPPRRSFGPGPSPTDPLFGKIGSGQIRQTARQPVVRNVSDDMFSPRSISQFKILSGDDLSEERKKRKKKFKKKIKGSKKKKTTRKEDPLAFRIARVPFG